MSRILVTGGAGFIGSNLCNRLIQDGHNVICLDNLFTGRRENILNLVGHERFEFVLHDVIEPYMADVDEILNLASPASPAAYRYDAIKTTATSVIGAINMLELAKHCGAKILQASTSEVYGDPEKHPQAETYWGHVNPIGIRSCYDEGKRCAESLFMDYHRKYNIRIKIIRIFNTYGPKMSPEDGRVVSNFIKQALLGKDITIYGTGEQTRSFQYIDDLIETIIRTMATNDDFTGPINTGNPGEFTILELAEKILELTGSKSKIVFLPSQEDDPKQRKPDISLAKEKLGGWMPEVQLEEGLCRTIEYFKSVLNNPVL